LGRCILGFLKKDEVRGYLYIFQAVAVTMEERGVLQKDALETSRGRIPMEKISELLSVPAL
jgi:hypothetical protein